MIVSAMIFERNRANISDVVLKNENIMYSVQEA